MSNSALKLTGASRPHLTAKALGRLLDWLGPVLLNVDVAGVVEYGHAADTLIGNLTWISKNYSYRFKLRTFVIGFVTGNRKICISTSSA